MRVAFLDLAADFNEVADDARARIDAILASQSFVLGRETAELEASMVELTTAGSAVACSSGSDALYLAMLALDIGPGDAVAVPSFTFFATAGAVARAGAQPVFVDIDPETFNAGSAQFAAAIEREFATDGHRLRHRVTGALLKALVPVHLFGRAVDMEGISALASRLGLAIVEDAAQAVGAVGSTAAVGAWGDVACFSFYPTKNIGTAGDGGMLTTCDAERAQRLRSLRIHGAGGAAYEHREVGINARMGELQAAVLNAKMPRLREWTAARVRVAERYRSGLAALERDGLLRLPAAPESGVHVYHQFTIRIASGRDAVQAALAEAEVDSRVFYPLPLHRQPCFAGLGYRAGDLPESERACREVLCLPIYAALAEQQVDFVCRRLAAAMSS